MTKTQKLLDDHFLDPDQLELADRAWDQIDHLLDGLVQTTACSNEAIRYLLGAISVSWLDPHDQLALEVNRKKQEGSDG